MSMFQIITQEGWTDVVVEILRLLHSDSSETLYLPNYCRTTHENFVPFVAIYFVGYHLLVTLVSQTPSFSYTSQITNYKFIRSHKLRLCSHSSSQLFSTIWRWTRN